MLLGLYYDAMDNILAPDLWGALFGDSPGSALVGTGIQRRHQAGIGSQVSMRGKTGYYSLPSNTNCVTETDVIQSR